MRRPHPKWLAILVVTFFSFATALTSQVALAGDEIEYQSLKGVIVLRGMRELAFEATLACVRLNEPSGQAALRQFNESWNSKYLQLSDKLDSIYIQIPARVRSEMELANRAKLGISEPAFQAFSVMLEQDRKELCSKLSTVFIPYATQPENMLLELGAGVRISDILAITDEQINGTRDRLEKFYRTPEAFKDLIK